VTKEPSFYRLHGSVKINARMMVGDAGKIIEEAIKHLTTLYGADVLVKLGIEAKMQKEVTSLEKQTLPIHKNVISLQLF
jgi:hypothetical protein